MKRVSCLNISLPFILLTIIILLTVMSGDRNATPFKQQSSRSKSSKKSSSRQKLGKGVSLNSLLGMRFCVIYIISYHIISYHIISR